MNHDGGPGWHMPARRRLLLALVPGVAGVLVPGTTWAGGQLEEPLVDSVRTALSAAIANNAPPVPEFPDTASRLRYLRWLGEMSQRLRRRMGEASVQRAHGAFAGTKAQVEQVRAQIARSRTISA